MRATAASASEKARLSVAFVLLPEFTLSTFSGFVDALRIASDEVDRSRQVHCRWTVLGPDRNAVRSSCGVEIAPWAAFSDPGDYDYTVVVGGLVRGHRRIDKRTLNYLRLVDERGGSLIGVCTGSFALARAGLMKGYRCCVHWHHLKEFTEEFPDHRVDAQSVFVIDGKRITCPGGQSAVDVAVHLVERHCGRSLALKVTSGMVIEAARGPKHPQPRPETKWFHEIRSGLVQRAILLMDQQSPTQRPNVEGIAARLGVSMRTLVRAFQSTFGLSPSVFMRALRLAHSRWEVLNTDKSVGWIASDFGFSDASHFTRLFRQYYGVTPQAAREAGGAGTHKPSLTIKPALRKILWGDPMSFAVIDWPSQEQQSIVESPARKR
ncbi:MAG TPA: GlxA family transcriptional regulator [Steroidobacter sp.]